MICYDAVRKETIRSHYNLATPFYWMLWGPHVHHGLWDPAEATPCSPQIAQERLTDTVADLARIGEGDRVLDVGCGMGGSSIRLAKRRGCEATGITISGMQRAWAAASARWHGVGRRTQFRRVDAESVAFPEESFDVLWSIECTEHLFDKAAFFRKASRWLAPGGRVAICAWLAAEDADRPGAREQVEQVCKSFLCPSLGSFSDYTGWMTDAGFVVDDTHDWTAAVTRTWEICIDRVRKTGVGRLAGWIDRDQADFIRHFATLLNAYRDSAMQYGCILAHRPQENV